MSHVPDVRQRGVSGPPSQPKMRAQNSRCRPGSRTTPAFHTRALLDFERWLDERDQPVIIGACLFCAAVFVTVNLLVDLLYGFLDPRIRQHG